MNQYELQQLLKRWRMETITAEQTIGQILLHLQSLSERVGGLEKQMEWQRQQQVKPQGDSLNEGEVS